MSGVDIEKGGAGRNALGQALDLKPKRVKGLLEILENVLDKGVAADLKLRTYLVGVRLIELEGMLTLASFKTAAKYRLPFPSGINLEANGWKELLSRVECRQCRKMIRLEDIEKDCPFCGYGFGDE